MLPGVFSSHSQKLSRDNRGACSRDPTVSQPGTGLSSWGYNNCAKTLVASLKAIPAVSSFYGTCSAPGTRSKSDCRHFDGGIVSIPPARMARESIPQTALSAGNRAVRSACINRVTCRVRLRSTPQGPAVLISAGNFGSVSGAKSAIIRIAGKQAELLLGDEFS